LNTTILLFLLQDGITNGAIYALLGLALVLVFAVTRVILIPQGEFITYGALTYATLSAGQTPGTARLAMAMGVVAFALDLFAGRKSLHRRLVLRALAINIGFPLVVLGLTLLLAGRHNGVAINIALSLLIVAAIGLFLYRIAFQPIAHTSVLVLLIASVGCHLALQGFGLVFFGAEGQRGPTVSSAAVTLGELRFTGQSIAVYAITVALIVGLWLFFGATLYGKALRATAVNRLGARLVGIRTSLSGQIAFLLASVFGAFSGILIVPNTTRY
jgi:branched-chain amino acid transport system permease protein